MIVILNILKTLIINVVMCIMLSGSITIEGTNALGIKKNLKDIDLLQSK